MIPPHGNVEFVAAMEQVLYVYRRWYDADCPVVCMDETPRQLIGETRAPLPMVAGKAKRQGYEYRRVGTRNIFMALEPLAGKGISQVTQRRTKKDWARFLARTAERYCEARKITLVMDILNTYHSGALYETYPPDQAKALWDGFEFVYTPKRKSV